MQSYNFYHDENNKGIPIKINVTLIPKQLHNNNPSGLASIPYNDLTEILQKLQKEFKDRRRRL